MAIPITLTKNDWSLHRKGQVDQARHAEKLKEALKENLGQIVSEESIVTSDGDRVVKVPIRSMELPKFRFDVGKKNQAGQGGGESKPGDPVGQDPNSEGPGQGKEAGNQPGMDYFEAEVSVDDLAQLMFEDFSLPNLEQKTRELAEVDTIRFRDIAKKGVMANLDKRRTIIENIKRNALQHGEPRFDAINPEDLRFRTWSTETRRETSAVVIAMRDVSGSMGEFEKYITRSFYFWMVRFLRQRYHNVEIVFITHHTEAKEVDEETFFKLGESGGTRVSSAYKLALDIIRQRYNPTEWNIYPFHFSDGDNWGDTDNRVCVDLVMKLIEMCNIFGYGEIREGGVRSTSTLMSAFSTIKDPKFSFVTITDKKDVYPALKRFFSANTEVPAHSEAA